MGATNSSQQQPHTRENTRRGPMRIVIELRRRSPGGGLAPEVASPEAPEFIFQPTQSDMPLRIFFIPGESEHLFEIMTRLAEAHSAEEASKIRPASKHSIDSLATRLIDKDCCPLHSCTICLDEWENRQKALELPCGHVFHHDCLLPWLNQSNTCPTCRYPLLTDDKEFNNKVQQDIQARGCPVSVQCAMKPVGLCEAGLGSNLQGALSLSCGHAFHDSCFITSLCSTNHEISQELGVGSSVRCPYCRESMTIALWSK